MRLQDYVADAAKEAAQSAFRFAKAVPEEKLDWTPEGGRSVLSICRELAMTPTWTMYAFSDDKHEYTEADAEANRKKQEQWTTVEECETEIISQFEARDTMFPGFTVVELS